MHALLLTHFVLASFQARDLANFNSVVYVFNMRFCEFIPVQRYIYPNTTLDISFQLRDRLTASVNPLEIQKKLLTKREFAFADARVIC